MRITLTSVFVDDQDKAERFYTEVLGFVMKHDVPVGGSGRWLTVVSPEDPDGTELLLEPSGDPAVEPFEDALASDGIPFAQFTVVLNHVDVDLEAERAHVEIPCLAHVPPAGWRCPRRRRPTPRCPPPPAATVYGRVSSLSPRPRRSWLSTVNRSARTSANGVSTRRSQAAPDTRIRGGPLPIWSKDPRLVKPTSWHTSVIDSSPARSSALARSRRLIRYRYGVSPNAALKLRRKYDGDTQALRANASTSSGSA